MNILFWFGIAFTLIAPIVIGTILHDHTTAWIAALCGAFVTFMAKLESVAELSLGPVKAKLRAKIEEASATIDQLRKVAVATIEASLTDSMAGSFMGGTTFRQRLELHDKLIRTLTDIGASSSEIAAAKSEWDKGIAIIYHRAIKTAVENRESPNRINPDASEQQKAAGTELQDLLDFDSWAVPTPDQMRTVMKKHNVLSGDAETWVNDYEHFLESGEIRRREEFVTQ